MGRTKKRHRAWKQQMRARAKRKLEWYRNYGDISPGRLVAWSGVTSYYARIQPANPSARPRQIERQKPRTYTDVTAPEVREMARINRQVDLVGQAITALVITVGALVLVYNLGRWLCGY